MYNVVFRSPSGLITWTAYPSKKVFEQLYKKKTRGEIVARGIAGKRAVELCSTPESTSAVMRSSEAKIAALHQEAGRHMARIIQSFSCP